MNKYLFFLLIFICFCSAAHAENSLSEKNSKSFIVRSDIDTSALKPTLLQLIKSHGYKYRKNTGKLFEMYFDSPELNLLNKNQSLRYQAREYTSKKNKIKYHEEIQLLTKSNGQIVYPVKHYKRAKEYEGKHLLIGMIKRKVRSKFTNDLKVNGINYPLRLRTVFSVSKILDAYEIFDNNLPVGTIVVTDFETSSQKNKIYFSEVKVIPSSLTGNFDKLEFIYSDLKKQYETPLDIKNNETKSEYSKIFQNMEEQVRFFHFRLKHPYAVYLLYSAFIVLIGLALVKLLFWNRFLTSK